MDALRIRLEEKESLLSKKSQQISEISDEKSTQSGEISDLKDMLDVKERKVVVLQKKVSGGCWHAHTHTKKIVITLSSLISSDCNFKPQPADGAVTQASGKAAARAVLIVPFYKKWLS